MSAFDENPFAVSSHIWNKVDISEAAKLKPPLESLVKSGTMWIRVMWLRCLCNISLTQFFPDMTQPRRKNCTPVCCHPKHSLHGFEFWVGIILSSVDLSYIVGPKCPASNSSSGPCQCKFGKLWPLQVTSRKEKEKIICYTFAQFFFSAKTSRRLLRPLHLSLQSCRPPRSY